MSNKQEDMNKYDMTKFYLDHEILSVISKDISHLHRMKEKLTRKLWLVKVYK